jgi:hypothetical protein
MTKKLKRPWQYSVTFPVYPADDGSAQIKPVIINAKGMGVKQMLVRKTDAPQTTLSVQKHR